MDIRPRRIATSVRAALTDTPVVVVNGARQVGKSTLVRHLDVPGSHRYLTLDDESQRAAAHADPRTFVGESPDLVIVDEVQLEPRLYRAIKATVDRDRRPGRFLLTGSSRLLSSPDMAEALAGRVEVLELWPFTQGELADGSDGWIDAVFDEPARLVIDSNETRQGYLDRIMRGGLPEAASRAGRRRERWFDAYATTVAQRVVQEVADIERQSEIPRILRLCAARTATEINVRSLSADLAIPSRTLDAYLAHLSNVFLIQLVPAWTTNLSAKVVRKPKVMLVDSGLACHLIGARLDATAAVPHPALGALVETFVGGELRRQATWALEPVSLAHFRDRGGQEVDFILEHADGRVVGVEVTASSTVTSRDFAGLDFLQRRLADRFHHGVVLHLGPAAVRFGSRLAALPLASLWTAPASSTAAGS